MLLVTICLFFMKNLFELVDLLISQSELLIILLYNILKLQ